MFYIIKDVNMTSKTDVMDIAINGRNAFVFSCRRQTFNPRPVIAMVSRKLVAIEISFIKTSELGIYVPRAKVPKKLITIKPIKNQGKAILL